MIVLLLLLSTKHTNKCRKSGFVTEKTGWKLTALRRGYSFGLTTARACS